MIDLVKLSQRINPLIPEDVKTSQGIYDYTMNDVFCSMIFKKIEPIKIIKVCFLLRDIRKGVTNLNESLSEMENMNCFSLIRFDNYAYANCRHCGGDGDENCPNCQGEPEMECEGCSGTGSDGDNNCDTCSGTGYESCSYCDGYGWVRCSHCDGTGSEVSGLEYSIKMFVSYSPNIQQHVKGYFDNELNIEHKVDEIKRNSKTIMFYYDSYFEDSELDITLESKCFVNHISNCDSIDFKLDGRLYSGEMVIPNSKFY